MGLPQLANRTPDDYWDKNGLKKPQPVIVCAAYAYYDPDGDDVIIVCGPRHVDHIMRSQIKLIPRSYHSIDGFVDQFCKFYNREQAMEVVRASGQRFYPDKNGSNKCFTAKAYINAALQY